MIHTLHRAPYKPLAIGTKVWWRFRSGIGHGEIDGVDKYGTSPASTRYRVKEFDHHQGEKNILLHWGSALHKA